ncbi:MAG TPA: DUF1538 domain-containing protein [Bacilli bacterium]|nr:DUF1538 domain-containing protein [Bacilli bacterium]HPS19029.1 DUF1538 domain-containing protein [Bacilli bacterium]
MKLLRYLREVFFSSLPLIVVVVIVTVFAFPLKNPNGYWQIGIGYVMVLVGQAVFLTGLDGSILPIGKLVGGSITKLNKIVFILLFGFLFGIVATVAEPAISVMSVQVGIISDAINPTLFIWIVGFGTGMAVAFAIYRIIKNLNIKIVFLIVYALVLILVFFVPEQYRALSFDASGATTGDVSVPFILALGVGISKTASKSKKTDESFGIIGIACVGSMIALFIYGLILGPGSTNPYQPGELSGIWQIIGDNLLVVTIAITPIIVIFFFFQLFFIKLPKKKIFGILLSSFVVFIGLFVFLVGIDYGFAYAGNYIGSAFVNPNTPDAFKWFLLPISFVLGFAITLTEPAVVVLGEQVEEITNGFLKKRVIKFSLALSIGIASILCICKVLFDVNILYFLVPLYAIALLLLIFTPKLFVGLAFDSGGVAAGAITSAFLTPLTLGASQALGQDILISGFGMISFMSATPLIIIQILGIIYERKVKKIKDLEHQSIENEIKPLLAQTTPSKKDGQNEQ